jgi:hypothetical protein
MNEMRMRCDGRKRKVSSTSLSRSEKWTVSTQVVFGGGGTVIHLYTTWLCGLCDAFQKFFKVLAEQPGCTRIALRIALISDQSALPNWQPLFYFFFSPPQPS